jgi:hypothetical protein
MLHILVIKEEAEHSMHSVSFLSKGLALILLFCLLFLKIYFYDVKNT